MTETSSYDDIDRAIAATRENLRALLEQATALSGAANESRISDRIEAQEAKLTQLLAKQALARKRTATT